MAARVLPKYSLTSIGATSPSPSPAAVRWRCFGKLRELFTTELLLLFAFGSFVLQFEAGTIAFRLTL